jgi:hypothetical protein
MDRPDMIEASSIADDPPSICEAKKRIAALGLGGPRTCGRCGQLRKGRMIVGYTGFFVCFNCLVRDEAKDLAETEEFIRKDKVWRIRKAREKWMNKRVSEPIKSIDPRYLADELPYQQRSEEQMIQNTLTEDEKEGLAKKLMSMIDLPVNCP